MGELAEAIMSLRNVGHNLEKATQLAKEEAAAKRKDAKEEAQAARDHALKVAQLNPTGF